MSTVALNCLCRCHVAVRRDYEFACQIGRWADAMVLSYDPLLNGPGWADVCDPVEAAVAQGCPCLKNHVHTFIKPTFEKPTDWTPDSDKDEG